MDLKKRLSAIVESRGKKSDAERVRELLDTSWEHSISEHPESATQFGYPGHNHRWTDMSVEAIARRKEDARLLLEAADSFDRELPPESQLDYSLLRKNLEWNVEGNQFPSEYLQYGAFGGPESRLPQIVEITPAGTLDELEALQVRLESIPSVFEQTIILLKKGIEEGVTSPKAVVASARDRVGAQIVEHPMESPLLRPFQQLPAGLPEKDAQHMRERATKTYTDQILPSLKRLQKFIADTYAPACRESIAFTALPGGEEWYAHLVRRYTTTDLTPKEIHEVGLAEVERIRSDMEDAVTASGFNGSFDEFFTFLREDPQFYFDSADDLLRTYRDICKRADPELAKLFKTLPRLTYGVVPVPDYLEKTSPTAYYQPGSPQAGRPGYFYANTYDLSARPRWEMEALSLHEAVPGHHLQIALASEMEGVPDFRKHMFFTAYIEGWGLYSESLGDEMGFYKDPYSKFGQLTYEMWRAIRLVVDTGMHAFGFTRDQAIDFFKRNAGKAEHDIVVEVDRYIGFPGQALAYKIGELKLKELRSFATKELGARFDIRAFHDEILRRGALPLDILEDHVKKWVREQSQEK